MGAVADRETREAWDAVAPAYARMLPDLAVESPLDRALIAAVVEMVGPNGCVADVGCGAGRVTAHLAGHGVRAFGVDLSPRMVAEAAASNVGIGFVAGDAGALPVRSSTAAGLLAWYSLISIDPSLVPDVLQEFARVTRPGTPILLAFQSGDGERVDRSSSYGQPVQLTYYRHRLSDVADAAAAAGFALDATVCRQPWQPHESTPQGLVIARRTDVHGTATRRAATDVVPEWPPARGSRRTRAVS